LLRQPLKAVERRDEMVKKRHETTKYNTW